jgi:hypothetical protein
MENEKAVSEKPCVLIAIVLVYKMENFATVCATKQENEQVK